MLLCWTFHEWNDDTSIEKQYGSSAINDQHKKSRRTHQAAERERKLVNEHTRLINLPTTNNIMLSENDNNSITSSVDASALGGGPGSSKPSSRAGSVVPSSIRRGTAASLLMAAVAVQVEIAEAEEEFVPYETPPTFPLNPVEYLHNRASDLSGVPHRRLTEVDESDLGHEMGDFHLHRLADSFYRHIALDPDDDFRRMFENHTIFNLAQNLGEFLAQRFGGQTFYSDRKGNLAMITKHNGVAIDRVVAERWLAHMNAIIDQMFLANDISSDQRSLLQDYFNYTAHYLVAAHEMQDALEHQGTRDGGEIKMPPPIEDEIDEQEIRAAFGRIDHHSPRDGDGDGKNNNDEKSVTTKTSLHL